MVTVATCPLSGLPARPHRVEILGPRGSVPQASCLVHVEIEVDVVAGERVGPGCRIGYQLRREVRTLVPAALRRWQRQQGNPTRPLPTLADGRAEAADSPPPHIIRPAACTVVMLVPGLAPELQELQSGQYLRC